MDKDKDKTETTAATTTAAAAPSRKRRGRLPKIALECLPNTTDALYKYWSPAALRLMIQAISTLVRSKESLQTETAFWTHPEPLYITIPPLRPGDAADRGTTTWSAALHRFATAPDHLLGLEGWATWARALILGMLAMTNSARVLMLSDSVALLRLRGARSPPLERRKFWITRMAGLLHAWYSRGYADARRFVLECAALYYAGDCSDYESFAFFSEMPPPQRFPALPHRQEGGNR